VKKLEVRLVAAPGEEHVVGELAETRGRTYFEYSPEFLRNPLWLSPFKLPPAPGLIEHRDLEFGPLFGLFDDSLPDGWGLLLMDRFLRARGSLLSEVSPLDRLAYLGTRTMGALTYHPPSDPSDGDPPMLDLHQLARASESVLRGSSAEVLPQLLRAGGSPGGARPKVLVGVYGQQLVSGEENLPHGFTHWMIKFAGERDAVDAGPMEFAYASMARRAGLSLPPTRLFETDEGGRYFGVKRFDRDGNQRLHIHTFGNLIHSNFRIPGCDYSQLLEVTRILTRNHNDVLECYRRMVFNVLAHNRDDHVKNFAFLMPESGDWELAPAYDLVYTTGPGGEHTMTVAGEGRSPTRAHMLELAAPAGVPNRKAATIIEEVASAVSEWKTEAMQASVSPVTTEIVEKAIICCLDRL
jgi:serine/threonine-protein kinase HipA